jgi:hypothetical protein
VYVTSFSNSRENTGMHCSSHIHCGDGSTGLMDIFTGTMKWFEVYPLHLLKEQMHALLGKQY